MSKFWGGAGALVVLALILLVFEGALGFIPNLGGPAPTVYDLETECRDQSEQSQVSLRGKKILMEGTFPFETTRADLDYRYSESSSSIKLNVRAKGERRSEDYFQNSCLAQVRYRIESNRLDPGSYSVKVLHNGEMERDTRITVP